MRDAGVSFIYTWRKKHTPCHPGPFSYQFVSSQFSRMGTPQEGSSLLSRQREAATLQLHNRRPRCTVHLTSQIYNSLTLCHVKRPCATALMDTDKWPPKKPLMIFGLRFFFARYLHENNHRQPQIHGKRDRDWTSEWVKERERGREEVLVGIL